MGRQKISEDIGPSLETPSNVEYDEGDVDESLAHIGSHSGIGASKSASKKGKVQQIAWDEGLDDLSREKKASEATRGSVYCSLMYGTKTHRTPCGIQISKSGSKLNLKD